MQSEQGHHPGRSYVDQDGEIHLNGSALRTDEVGGSINGTQLNSLLSGGGGGSASSIVVAAVDSATVIEVGDIVWLDTDDVKPASDFTWDTDLATTQGTFAAQFLGIALEASANGETTPIQVETDPSYLAEDFGVASGNYEIGAYLGPDQIAGPALSNDTLEVCNGTCAIARAAARGTAVTALDVRFGSAYHPGSANVNAHIG